MKAREKLYTKDNIRVPKVVSIDDTLYNKLVYISDNIYWAKISELVNIAIEEYVERNKPSFYIRPSYELASYRNIHFRKNNMEKIEEYSEETSISFNNLVNGAIKEFVDSFDIKLEE